MIDVAVAKGDLNSAEDLHMYCAAATAACNLEYIFNGHTVLEFLTGEIPRTRSMTAAQVNTPDILGALDTEFVDQLRTVLIEQNELLQFIRDDEARYNATVREANAQRRVTTTFDLRPGDQVSHEGVQHTLLEVMQSSNSEPTKATIRVADHDTTTTKVVTYDTLRPLASPRPVHMHTTTDIALGKFAFYTDPTTHKVKAGTITNLSADSATATIHVHERSEVLVTRHTPLYLNTRNGKHERKEKPQPHHEPVTIIVPCHDIIVTGSIHNYHVGNNMLDALKSLGVLEN